MLELPPNAMSSVIALRIGVRRHDLAGGHALLEQLHDAHAGVLGEPDALRVDRGDRAVARQPHADRLDQAVHRVGGEEPGAAAARGAGVVLELEQVLLGHRARRDLADGGEHGVEVDRLALRPATGEHRPAGDDHGRQVEPRGGHEHAGDDLVAVGDQHDRVERVRRDGDLDGVGDDLAARERVAHPHVVHRDAVAHADGRDLDRRAAGHADARLHRVGDLVEHQVAGDDLVRRVDDGDERPRDLLVGETVGLQETAVRGLGQAALHAVALQLHTPPFPLTCRDDGAALPQPHEMSECAGPARGSGIG